MFSFYREQDYAPAVAERRPMTAQEVHAILKKIPPPDMQWLGLNAEFARPDWMILTVLPVPPAPVRPSVTSPGKASAQDDLTYKLADIIKANATVQKCEQEGSPSYVTNGYVELLQVRRIAFVLARSLHANC